MVITHAEFLANPFGKEIGHVVVFRNHVLSDEFIEKSSFFGEFPIDCFGTGINEAVDVRIKLTDTLQNIERSHTVDCQVLTVIKGSTKCSGNMIDGIHTFNGFFNILVFAQIAKYGFNAFSVIPFSDTIDITGINEAAYSVSFC